MKYFLVSGDAFLATDYSGFLTSYTFILTCISQTRTWNALGSGCHRHELIAGKGLKSHTLVTADAY